MSLAKVGRRWRRGWGGGRSERQLGSTGEGERMKDSRSLCGGQPRGSAIVCRLRAVRMGLTRLASLAARPVGRERTKRPALVGTDHHHHHRVLSGDCARLRTVMWPSDALARHKWVGWLSAHHLPGTPLFRATNEQESE